MMRTAWIAGGLGLALVGCGQTTARSGNAGAAASGGAHTAQGGSGQSGNSGFAGAAGHPTAGSSTGGTSPMSGAGASASAGTAGRAGSSGTTGTSGASGESGAGGSTAAGAGGVAGAAGRPCPSGCNGRCCGDACINPGNDIYNCGDCGHRCEGEHPFCDQGVCRPAPTCTDGTTCEGDAFCCGSSCCTRGQLCCAVPGPVTSLSLCVAAGEGVTCPFGCLGCNCNSPDTPIATPAGDRAIATLRAGDMVYSIDGSAIVAVPILFAVENPVHDHHVVRLRLSGGVTLEISANHPLADGRTIGQLAGGDSYEGARIESTELIRYSPAATFDILPSSSTGIYFAAGLPLRSTLR